MVGKLVWVWVLCFPFVLAAASDTAEEGDAFSTAPRVPAHLMALFSTWHEETLRLARPNFPQWQADLDQLDVHGISGLRRHATPATEPRLPRTFRQMKTLWLIRHPFNRPSTKQLQQVTELITKARVNSGYEEQFLQLPREELGNLLWHLDEYFLVEFNAQRGYFEDRVSQYHERHSPPLPFEWEASVQHYLEIWVLGALWHEAREHTIKFLLERGFMPSERFFEYDAYIDTVGDCRIALIRMANSRYSW